MIEDFWNELSEGDIHVRDNLQFELKSEFFVNQQIKKNIYKQEVFLFIPNALQINSQTYSKEEFYLDQTNLIRYKTPYISLINLVDPNYSPSPLNRLQSLLQQYQSNPDKFTLDEGTISDEIKLFAAIFRASLRGRIYKIVKKLRSSELQQPEKLPSDITLLCKEVADVSLKFRQIQELADTISDQNLIIQHFKYADEFISITIEEFFIILLKQFRLSKHHDPGLDKQLCNLIFKEKSYRKKMNIGPRTSKRNLFANESILYREGLLNRFIMEALMLKYQRFSLVEKHSHIFGAAAAGIAMFFYMGLLVWRSSGFIINSFPFVALAVFLYILKDRIKEGFKSLYYKEAYRWFPDYSTVIRSPNGMRIGKLNENFAFIESSQVPPEFLKIRNSDVHEELPGLQRHETIIHYKREMTLQSQPSTEMRRKELTSIFRLNIYRFLQKASNAYQPQLIMDPYSSEITEKLLPKVYHLNLIICNSYLQSDLTFKNEIKRFRVVVDKKGIKRIKLISNLNSGFF